MQVPKTFHQKFLFPALGHYHVDLDLSVLSTTPVEALSELLLLIRNPSLLVLKIYGKANFLKMLIDVAHDNLRTVLLQTPNTSHFNPF